MIGAIMHKFRALIPLLRCLNCTSDEPLKDLSEDRLHCKQCNSIYPVNRNRPIIFSEENDLFEVGDYVKEKTLTTRKIYKIFSQFIPGPSVNLFRKKALREIDRMLSGNPSAKILVVGGGEQRQQIEAFLNSMGKHLIYCCDVDINADIDVFCDAHNLPFGNNTFDLVVTTAVLEHVIRPERVAAEIYRVVKLGGILYSEIPFLQQVHEGAYDFTRFTHSGHRRLFNGFTETKSGIIAGPATVLVWSIESFLLMFFVNTIFFFPTKIIIRLAIFWIKYLDLLLVNNPAALDGASCTYFLGQKICSLVPDSEIIKKYSGAQNLTHT